MRHYKDDLDELTPLKRAEHIVDHGPDYDAGPVPCEDTVEPQCLTFTDLNRLRYSVAECGCQFEGADRIGLCKTHDVQGAGPKVTYEETEESFLTGWEQMWGGGGSSRTSVIGLPGESEDED